MLFKEAHPVKQPKFEQNLFGYRQLNSVVHFPLQVDIQVSRKYHRRFHFRVGELCWAGVEEKP